MQDRFYQRYKNAWLNNNNGMCKSFKDEVQVLLSEADTFIEFCFEKKCAQMKNGMEVMNEWRYHKDQYRNITDTTIYDFQHYSRHDASHSISILEVIEMILGEQRIVQLSRGDLWLLLEAAYSHDLGMTRTGKEMADLWSDKRFKEYLLDNLQREGTELQEATSYYKQMDNMLHRKAQMSGMKDTKMEAISFEECWPATISNYVEWIVTNYIRKQHAQRNVIVRKRIVTLKNSEIPSRLYEQVAEIASLHTEDYASILDNLPYEVKGIGAETLHPRFVAAMLRLGDVLDTDNNRFSIYALEHMFEVPKTSLNHLNKHRAIDNIQISTEEIFVSAVSDDLVVCKETREWFSSIEREVACAIRHWNELAPNELKGCKLKPSKCKVFYHNKEGRKVEYYTNQDKAFEINKQELIQLLVGSNIYDTELDFIREYLQNALDASKMQLWEDLKQGLYDELLNDVDINKKLNPYQIPKEIYDRYKVKIKIQMVSGDYDNVKVTIEDNGIGMERECISVVSNLGSGWRKREKYSHRIYEMPSWLKPTGGFGIGIQSAFMMTRKVILHTKAEEDTIGRKITLESPDTGGRITTEEKSIGRRGTTVITEIPIEKFLSWNPEEINVERTKVDWKSIKGDYITNSDAIFSTEYMEAYIVNLLYKYISEIVPNSLFPISISARGLEAQNVSSRFWDKRNEDDVKRYPMKWKEKEYIISIFDGEYFTIWDCEKEVLFHAMWKYKPGEKRKAESIVCYKNIRMTHEYASAKESYKHFDILVDYMGFQAKDVLKIHRNEFAEGFEFEEYISRYMEIYLHIFRLIEEGKISAVIKPYQKTKKFFLTRLLLTKDLNNLEYLGKLIKNYEREESENYENFIFKLSIETQREIVMDGNDEVEGFWFEYDLQREKMSEFYKRYIAFLKKNENRSLLFEGFNLTNILGEAKTKKNIIRWFEDNRGYIDFPYIEEINSDHVMQHVFKEGIFTGFGEFLPMMLENNSFSYKYCVIFSDDNELKRGFYLFYNDKINNEKEDEKDFYKLSYGRNEEQIILSNRELIYNYEELLVEKLPYGIKVIGSNAPYLISPITNKLRLKYEKARGMILRNRVKISQKAFLEDVMNEEEFEFLISWVAKYSISLDYRGNKSAIREKYKEYIENIFKYNKEMIIRKEEVKKKDGLY